MLFVWITSYLFAVVVGGILTMSAFYFWATHPTRKKKRDAKKNSVEIIPSDEFDIPEHPLYPTM